MHFPSVVTMIYTFILSFVMIYLYDKFKTLKAPILFHIGINITMNILIYILVKNNIVISTLLLLMGLFGVVTIISFYEITSIKNNCDNLT